MNAVALTLRPYTPADAPRLAHLFRDTIRRVNVRDYTEAQVRAWAPDDIEPERWASRFEGRFVVVTEAGGTPVGFAELEADGHIDRFYVSADHQGIGVGRAMLEAVIAEGRRLGLPRLFTEASITAKPFFERHGFVVLAEQTVTVRGVGLTNYRMELVGQGGPSGSVRTASPITRLEPPASAGWVTNPAG